jgi:hypothetical protein
MNFAHDASQNNCTPQGKSMLGESGENVTGLELRAASLELFLSG